MSVNAMVSCGEPSINRKPYIDVDSQQVRVINCNKCNHFCLKKRETSFKHLLNKMFSNVSTTTSASISSSMLHLQWKE